MDRYDAIIVGGSFAGLSAAMQLARARRRILLVDAGRPRNRFAKTSHGFLGQDGVPPAQIMREGLTQFSRYPSLDFEHVEAVSVSRDEDGVTLALSDGRTGRYITVDAMQQTSVPGVFAAGDAATAMFNATIASAAGVMAGVSAHRALVLEDAAEKVGLR